MLTSIRLDQIYQVISIADQRLTKIHGNGAKNLFDLFLCRICVYPFCKMDSLKIVLGLNHYKCTGRTSNNSGFLSSDIVPTRICDKSKD